MNNIVQLNANKPEAFSEDSPLYFDVWERPAYFKGNEDKYYLDPNHKHIVRMWDNKPISIGTVGSNYTLLKNKTWGEAVEDVFMQTLSREELHGVQRRDRISHLGAKSVRDYIFPNIKADINSDRSSVSFRAITVNGYDGSSSFKFYHGAIDFFCTNGMVTGSYDMITRKHTKGLTIPNLTDRLRKSIEIFYKQAEQWKHWVGKEISDEDAEQCYKAMPNISDRRVSQLMRQFQIEIGSHGRTVWALYSAATYYASTDDGEFRIRETESDHRATTLLNREQQVRSWLNTDEFQQVAA